MFYCCKLKRVNQWETFCEEIIYIEGCLILKNEVWVTAPCWKTEKFLKEFVSEKLIFLHNLIISIWPNVFYHRIVKIFLSSNLFIQKSLTKVWNNSMFEAILKNLYKFWRNPTVNHWNFCLELSSEIELLYTSIWADP